MARNVGFEGFGTSRGAASHHALGFGMKNPSVTSWLTYVLKKARCGAGYIRALDFTSQFCSSRSRAWGQLSLGRISPALAENICIFMEFLA